MRKRPSNLRKFFSFNRWKRRFGASKLTSNTSIEDLELMKYKIIEQGDPVLSRGSANDIQEHYLTLRREFSGQAELAFYHAILIVQIRREFMLAENFAKFELLWRHHENWLLENLNIRWLVSACDTFADHSKDPEVRALAISTSLLANTVKVYETENVMTNRIDIQYDPKMVNKVQQMAIPLIDGMACFTVGTDDTLRNMLWRMKGLSFNSTTGRILTTVFQRLTTLPCAYGRLRNAHTRKKTEFWD